jgi:metallophosphoesterase (TIGR03767 family)
MRDPNGTGAYRGLVAGAGEPYQTSSVVLVPHAPADNRVLISFAQMSDLHIVDHQSPLRVEFLDRYGPDNPTANFGTDSAYRAHEMLTTQLTDAMCRAIRHQYRGPVTGIPLRLTLVTGDVVDNCQYNEARWYIDLLDGGRIEPNSGAAGDQSVSGNAFGVNRYYWHPELRQWELDNGGLDHNFLAGFPSVPGLLGAAHRPFQATGLGMPWYAAFGNHDVLVQGNAPTWFPFIGRLLDDVAVGTFKPTDTRNPLSDGSQADAWYLLTNLIGSTVTADPRRRLLSKVDFIREHFTTTGTPRGHGFVSGRNDAYYAVPSPATDLFQFIALDSADDSLPDADGSIDDDQFEWLEDRLRSCSSRYRAASGSGFVNQPGVQDKLVIVFCHHTLDTMNKSTPTTHHGDELRALLLRFPNVIMLVNGHKHANSIRAHGRADGGVSNGFAEINTASHIDWPVQSRLIEVTEGDGVLSIYTTMIDADAPLSSGGDLSTPAALASLGRELAANDIQEVASGIDRRRGVSPATRNARLLLPAPFPIVTWGARIAATRAADGRIHVVATTADDAVVRTQQATAGATAYTAWSLLDGRLRAVALGTNSAGRPMILGVNRSATIFTREQLAGGGWSGTAQHPGLLASVALTTNVDGRREMFGANAQGATWHRWQTAPGSTTWSAWAQLDGLLTQVAVSNRPDGSIVLFGVNVAGQVFARWQLPGGGWSAWQWFDPNPGTLTSIAVARNADGHLEVFGTNNRHEVVHRWETTPGGAWTAWTPFGGELNQIAAAINADGRVEVFGLDRFEQPYHRWQLAGGGWSDWTPMAVLA